ncbi:type I restriction modification DNA specificity domain protein [Firmicutes bacterium CAG:791]|nr:type I restriction modification DNA specificity domain protein [Firmicutes bacterium CAG:791]
MGKKQVPAIRFQGFTDAWEQRKFDDWGEFYYGHSCPKWSVTEDATIPCVRYGELYTKFGTKIDKVYSYTNMPSEKLRFSKGTEVLIPRVGEDPWDYNHCTWLSMPGVAIGEMISVFNTDQNPLFSAIMFNAILQKEFAIRVEGGSVTNLYFEKLKNIDVSYPSMAEQIKIASYFQNLDHLIILHQRKYEKLLKVKKSMLEKMFPRDGADVPEIRFDGFTDAWEQRKLGDMVSFSKGSGYSKGELKEDGTPIILYGRLYTKYETVISEVDTFADEKKGSVYSKGGEVIVPASGETAEDISIASVVEKSGVLLGGDLNIITPPKNIDSAFLAISISNGKPHNDMAKMAQGKSVVHLHNSDLEKIDLPYPNYDEQKRISGFFSNLDNLITLHQRKLEKLKNIKKSLLEKMFV